jgi:hypothetical protein
MSVDIDIDRDMDMYTVGDLFMKNCRYPIYDYFYNIGLYIGIN